MLECILCLNKILKKNSVKLDTRDECELTVEELIKLHFSFFDAIFTHKSARSQPVTCKTCWNKVESFHEFFCAVKFNHKVDESSQSSDIQETTTIFIKNEASEAEDVQQQDDDDFRVDILEDYSSEVDETEGMTRKRKAEDENAENAELASKKKLYDVTAEDIDVLKVHADFKCEKCPQKFDTWKDVRMHYRQKHNMIGYLRCCGRKIERVGEIKDHVMWHLNPHIFQCHICGKSAISRDNLKLHEQMHIPDSDRKFSCDICDKKFVNKYNLNMHSKVHEKDGKTASIPCSFCDKLYKTDRQLKHHISFCHTIGQNSWICHICSKVLKSKSTLDIHVKAHTNPDNPIECDLCGHILKNKRRFAVHMSKHRSAENGPYRCEKGCGKLFKHRPAMLDHIAFVHTKNRFGCAFCGKEFKHKKVLDEHEATQHNGMDPYSCPFCDRTFKNSSNMHTHKKKTHPDECKSLPKPSYLKKVLGGNCE